MGSTARGNAGTEGTAAQAGEGREGTGQRPVLAQRADPEDHGALAGSAVRLVEGLLDTGIDGKGPFDSAHTVADTARTSSPDAEGAVDRIIREHMRLGVAGGFVTSLGGFITMPVALPANVIEFYLLATRMTAATAAVRGYDIRRQHIRSAVLLTLVGADADDLLAKAGLAVPGGRLSNLAAQRLPGPALLVVNKSVGFRLLTDVGGKTFAKFGKGVPVVGGLVGAGVDAFLLKRIADSARHEFPQRARGVSLPAR